MWMRQKQQLDAAENDDNNSEFYRASDSDEVEELGQMHMLGAKYAIEMAKKSAQKPKKQKQVGKKPNEVKSKFKELMDANKKK